MDLAVGRAVSSESNLEFSFDFVAVGGTFDMGDPFGDGHPADGEGPRHRVDLTEFDIATTSVTNDDFARFVADTGFVTTAERLGTSAVFAMLLETNPGARAHVLGQAPGVPWWVEVSGANWAAPEGPGSTIDDRRDHPVVHISWDDARAYCEWSGTRLPSEAEWELASRGGLKGRRYPWGNRLLIDGEWNCNIWQGEFPRTNTLDDGFVGTGPARHFAPNGLGLFNTVGNGAPTGSPATTTSIPRSPIRKARTPETSGSCAVGHSCATTPTAIATGWPPARRTLLIPRLRTSASASSERRSER